MYALLLSCSILCSSLGEFFGNLFSSPFILYAFACCQSCHQWFTRGRSALVLPVRLHCLTNFFLFRFAFRRCPACGEACWPPSWGFIFYSLKARERLTPSWKLFVAHFVRVLHRQLAVRRFLQDVVRVTVAAVCLSPFASFCFCARWGHNLFLFIASAESAVLACDS